MRNAIPISFMLCIMIICAGTVAAQQKGPAEAAVKGVIETVATGCEKELAAYCQGVTPGEGRILACLYAHADRLSGQCENGPLPPWPTWRTSAVTTSKSFAWMCRQARAGCWIV